MGQQINYKVEIRLKNAHIKLEWGSFQQELEFINAFASKQDENVVIYANGESYEETASIIDHLTIICDHLGALDVRADSIEAEVFKVG